MATDSIRNKTQVDSVFLFVMRASVFDAPSTPPEAPAGGLLS